jgi:hypothetical protein
MNALVLPLTDDEKLQISAELEKLFAFQDRPLIDKKKALLVTAIADHGYPFGAIIAGIKSLFDEDLKSIKLPDILEACRNHIERGEETESINCVYCNGGGGIPLVDESKSERLFLCVCKNASRISHHRLARWNGQLVQIVKGKTLYLPERFRERVPK